MNSDLVMTLGMLVGLIIGVRVVVFLFRKKVVDLTFDERQELARGKAYQYGFMTLMACVVLYGAADSICGKFCDTLTGCTICIGIAMVVFASICIWKDAYMSLREKPGTIMIVFGIVTVINLAIGVLYWADGSLFENGMLTIRGVNPVVGVMTFVIMIVYGVDRLVKRKEETE